MVVLRKEGEERHEQLRKDLKDGNFGGFGPSSK